jgi:Ribonuclease G/E
MSWVQSLKRVFAIECETCPHCGGTLRVIACIEEPALIARILGHVQQRLESDNKLARAPPGHQEQKFKLI